MLYQLEERRVRLIGAPHYVAHNATIIGSVTLLAGASVWFNAVLRGDNEPITVGEQSNIQDGAVLHTDDGFPLTVGREVTVGHMAMLHGCTIGNNSLVGIKAVVMNGAMIGECSIVGAGALVTEGKRIPPRSLVLGSPGRVVRTLSDEEIGGLAEFVDHYIDKTDRYSRSFRPDTGIREP